MARPGALSPPAYRSQDVGLAIPGIPLICFKHNNPTSLHIPLGKPIFLTHKEKEQKKDFSQ